MNYCRFQNTLSDLQDCADSIYSTELNEEEKAARTELLELCQELGSVDIPEDE